MHVSKFSIESILLMVSVTAYALNPAQAWQAKSEKGWQAKRQLSDSATRRRPEFIYYEEKVPEYTVTTCTSTV